MLEKDTPFGGCPKYLMLVRAAVSVDTGRGATLSSRKEESYAPITDERHGSAGAVHVQTNAAPNEVIAFRRTDDGSLDLIESMATGGDGDGSPHLQSQGSVTLTSNGQYLLVTNAASEDVSVFSVAADGSIELRERVHTGSTPRSVAESDGLVVVLNTREPSLASFRLNAEGIERVEGGDQRLDASHADPAQVAFSPDGSMVVITERATIEEDSGAIEIGSSDSSGENTQGMLSLGGTLAIRRDSAEQLLQIGTPLKRVFVSDSGEGLGDRLASRSFGEDIGAWHVCTHERDLIGKTNQGPPGPGKQRE